VPFGLVADYKEDVIASGKVSVYFTPGLYLTDQTSEAQGAIVKGSLLSCTAVGLLAVAQSGDYVVGICTEDTDDAGFIELYLNISGYVLP